LVMQSLSEVPQRQATIQLLIAAAITRLDHEEQEDQHTSAEGRGELRSQVSLLMLGVPYQVGPLCRAAEVELEQLEQPKTAEQLTRVVAVLSAFTQAERARLIQRCLELVEERDARMILSKAQAPISATARATLAAFRNLGETDRETAIAWTVELGAGARAAVNQSGSCAGSHQQNRSGAVGNEAVSWAEVAGYQPRLFKSPERSSSPPRAVAQSSSDSLAEISDDFGLMVEEQASQIFRRSAPSLPSAGTHHEAVFEAHGVVPHGHEQAGRRATDSPSGVGLHIKSASSAERDHRNQRISPFVEEDHPRLQL